MPPKNRLPNANPEYQGRHRAANEQSPVPEMTPARIAFCCGVEGSSAQNQGEQGQDQGDEKAGKRRSVNRRPCGKDRTTTEDEPDLTLLPSGPTTLIITRRFVIAAQNGNNVPTPRSKPSVMVPISRMPTNNTRFRKARNLKGKSQQISHE